MGNLTKNFSTYEFACPCCGLHPDQSTLLKIAIPLQRLRDNVNLYRCSDNIISIHSGYRCPKHNREVGGGKNSQHLYGRAADIHMAGKSIIPEEQTRFDISHDLLRRIRELESLYPNRVSPIVLAYYAALIPSFFNGGIGVYTWGLHLDIRGKTARWGLRWRKPKK